MEFHSAKREKREEQKKSPFEEALTKLGARDWFEIKFLTVYS